MGLPGRDPSLILCETFLSLQGEGALAGWPCYFIRLSGCNLRCRYCDTQYAYEGGEPVTVTELVAAWRASGIPLVQVTGGEPLLQPTTRELLAALVSARAEVLLETNGSLPLTGLPREIIKVVDRKTPGSGMAEHWLAENLRWLGPQDQLKFVLTDRSDYLWAREEIYRLRLSAFTQVLLSPAWESLLPSELAEWIVTDRLPVRFQIQLHKVLWGEKKGV